GQRYTQTGLRSYARPICRHKILCAAPDGRVAAEIRRRMKTLFSAGFRLLTSAATRSVAAHGGFRGAKVAHQEIISPDIRSDEFRNVRGVCDPAQRYVALAD